MSASKFDENFFESGDGLQLYYRDYTRAGQEGLPILCLHGLTRNSRDFGPIAERLAAHHRVVAPDIRGRGRSDHDSDWHNYHPAQYVADALKLLDALGLERVVLLGTSMGGMMSMLMHHERPDSIAAVVLNDVGPRFNAEGIARIAAGMDRQFSTADLGGAVAATKSTYAIAYPNWDEARWRWFAEITYRQVPGGRYDLNSDRNIAVAVREGLFKLRVDPSKLFAEMRGTPVLLVRGALSDILTDDIVAEMRDIKPDLEVVLVPDTGHTPLLDEPEAQHAILEFLGGLD